MAQRLFEHFGSFFFFFVFNDAATTEIYPPLHDALPICLGGRGTSLKASSAPKSPSFAGDAVEGVMRSEEHTSELQSPCNLVRRPLPANRSLPARRGTDCSARALIAPVRDQRSSSTPPGQEGLRSVLFLNDTATAESFTLSLHDALPI